MELTYLKAIAAGNFLLSGVIFFVCFCRSVVSDKTVLRRVRLKYVLLGPAAMGFGLKPVLGGHPDYTDTILLIAVAVGLFAETFQWRWGAPDNVKVDTVVGSFMNEDHKDEKLTNC